MATYTRGSTVTFYVTFVDSIAAPIVPVDSTYPRIQIDNPAASIVASGIGTATATPGQWSFETTFLDDASIGDNWLVTWTLADVNHDTHTYREAFGISAAVDDPVGLERTGSYLVRAGSSERLIWRGSYDPEDITLYIEDNTGVLMTYLVGETVTDAEWEQADLTYAQDGCDHVYYLDSPVFDCMGSSYQVIWASRETTLSPLVYDLQTVLVPHNDVWYHMPYLRLLIDKLNKATTTPLSYLPEEMARAFDQGLGLLNSVHPITSWVIGGIPNVMSTWWVLCSGLWMLNARQILEIEVSHELNSQTVSLSFDHASPLSEVMSRWQEMIQSWLMPVKFALVRKSNGTGVVGVRPSRLGYRHRVYRVNQTTSVVQEFPTALAHLGLFL